MSLITETRTRLVSTATYGCSDRTPGIWIRYPISAVDPTDACLNNVIRIRASNALTTFAAKNHQGLISRERKRMCEISYGNEH